MANNKEKESYRWEDRPMSWSQISSFEWDKEGWYKKYYLNIRDDSNASMDFGKHVGTLLASDPLYLPVVPRLSTFEYELKCNLSGIELVGYIDTFDLKSKRMREYKTSANKKKWTKESAQSHRQLHMYALCLYLIHKIKPEELKIHLDYIPVQETGSFEVELSKEPVQSFEVKLTTKDILGFGSYIIKVRKEMESYALAHKK